MDSQLSRDIANRFLPSRWHYHYARSKLRQDPVFDAVCNALHGSNAPLLDVGCGMGLLAHALHAQHMQMEYLGVDNDAAKLAHAQRAALGLTQVRFAKLDLQHALPAHHGSVVMLDVLQYLAPAVQQRVLEHACTCIAPGTGKLVIRTGLADGSWRHRFTYLADVFTRSIRWMNSAPQQFPTHAQLQHTLQGHGLHARFQPLWGNTPFNNWLVVATHEGSGKARTA